MKPVAMVEKKKLYLCFTKIHLIFDFSIVKIYKTIRTATKRKVLNFGVN